MLYAAKYGWHDLLDVWLGKLKDPRRILNVQNREGETVLGWTLKFAARQGS